MNKTGSVIGISGPVVRAAVDFPVRLFEIVHVGQDSLLGEVIRIRSGAVDIQVYEETSGMRVGEPVAFSGELLSVELGPGLLGSVLDGIGRPLTRLREEGLFIGRGANIGTLDEGRRWTFSPIARTGDTVNAGDTVGTLPEGARILHKVMLPPNSLPGRIEWIAPAGEMGLREPVCRLEDGREIFFSHRWEVRRGRPFSSRMPFNRPLMTGQRILDTLFPLALGGAAVIPGGFGTGKTVTQQSLAKWCNADVIVYIGCGERGNEMTEVLEEFPTLMDPYHNIPLMERMVLVANTSNMPVAAREASIYLGMTIAEFYRDMGYAVAIMADSTSRWAEALREIGGRLEEMPGEEGYPAYLGTRLAQYYERAGRVRTLGAAEQEGSISVINAVSPPGGDFSEPVTQSSLRLSGTFWALDKTLAQQRHFPAINWQNSYTLYDESLSGMFAEKLGEEWQDLRLFLAETLSREKALLELVQLVGRDGLSEQDKWILNLSELFRVVYLQQNAFDSVDAYCSLDKMKGLLETLRTLDILVSKRLGQGVLYEQFSDLPFRSGLLKLRGTPDADFSGCAASWLEETGKSLNLIEVVIR
jgi:V/A-type H+-transporting ATPase subunit A